MKKKLSILFLMCFTTLFSQVKISGVVVDDNDKGISFANVVFVNSTIGTVSDENGHFYLESDITHPEVEISFIGYETKILKVKRRDFNLRIVLNEMGKFLSKL